MNAPAIQDVELFNRLQAAALVFRRAITMPYQYIIGDDAVVFTAPEAMAHGSEVSI